MPTLTPSFPTEAQRTPFHLSDEQVRFYDENGYLILRQQITGPLLKRLQEAGDYWIAQGLESARLHPDKDQNQFDYRFAQRPQGKVFFRVDFLHAKNHDASLELLGSPQVLAVAESLSGRNFVPTYESMVFKMSGNGEVIPWHQDAVFPRKFRVYNYDLYLDSSKKGAGALHVLPGTQKQTQDICKIAEYGWDHPDMLTVEMEPGDVLIHDDMVVHGSPRTEASPLRRTIYLEFRSAEQILTEGPFDRDWVNRRLRLIPTAMRHYAKQEAYAGQPRFEWKVDAEYRPDLSTPEETRILHTGHTPGSYCSAGSSLVEKKKPAKVAEPALT